MPSMVSRRYKRQAILFLVAVLLPAVVFVGLALQVIQQGDELARRRLDEERSYAMDRVRRELTSRLNEIKTEEIDRMTESPAAPSEPSNPAVVFAGPVEAARIRFASFVAQPLADLEAKLPGQAHWEMQRAEELSKLAADFNAVRTRIESAEGLGPNESAWLAYGNEPWLITITPPAPPLPALVFVVSSHQVAPDTVFVRENGPGGMTLGGNFPDLGVLWPPNRFTHAESSVPTPVFITGLALVVGIMSFVGYLLLRDVNREAGLAEMRTQFVADVSHEIKTPLTAIRLYADKLALGSKLDEQTRSTYVDTIISESERLGLLVDNVLAFAEIESGARVYQRSQAALAVVVESAARAVDYLFAQRGFHLSVSIDDGVPMVRVDAGAMEQAIVNLLVNAMKYSGDAREIDLRLRRKAPGVIIEVADKGVGIDVQDQVRIFEKFHRVRTAETGHVAGTGLGLALVQHIARAHGGHVEVKSARGKGSTFSIHLPQTENGVSV
jgi:two-component system phosphate regulon sensor histidine kinase PhoR